MYVYIAPPFNPITPESYICMCFIKKTLNCDLSRHGANVNGWDLSRRIP